MHMVAEIRTFLIMLLGGLIVSGVYDIYRWVWLKKHRRGWEKHLGDLIFMFIVTAIIIVLLFFSNWGELRSYVFLGLGAGLLIYYKILKKLVGYVYKLIARKNSK